MMKLNEQSAIPATTRGTDWFRLKIASALLFLTMLAAPHYSHTQEVQNKSWVGYYPLAMGNSWTYRVSGNSETRPTVWKVINVKPDASGPVFAADSSIWARTMYRNQHAPGPRERIRIASFRQR